VVFDPISSFEASGTFSSVKAMLMLLVDYLKQQKVTTVFTSLTDPGSPAETSEVGISSLIDTWLLVRNLELAGERTRGLYVLKARGMAHSNQVREFLLTDHGLDLIDVYVGPAGVLTGSAKATQELQDAAASQALQYEVERKKLILDNKQRALEAKIAEMRAEFEAERREAEDWIAQSHAGAENMLAGRVAVSVKRGGDLPPKPAELTVCRGDGGSTKRRARR
jgi:circadian clock protein KaiC